MVAGRRPKNSWQAVRTPRFYLADKNHGSFFAMSFSKIILTLNHPHISTHRLRPPVIVSVPALSDTMITIYSLSGPVEDFEIINRAHANSHRVKPVIYPVVIGCEGIRNINIWSLISLDLYGVVCRTSKTGIGFNHILYIVVQRGDRICNIRVT